MTNKDKARIFRERWFANQEVYGRQWKTVTPEGKTLTGFAPVCENFWTSGCHIKKKDGISCGKCEIKKYAPVTEESVLKHITGEEPQIQYVLQSNGSACRFAAFDFDKKPGKEKFAYEFADVKKVANLLDGWGITYGIARSTGLGYHLYMFFSDFVEAKKIRSVMMEVADRCGFISENTQGIRPLLEIFPKNNNANNGLGNGIKCPMIETSFEKERNCFVTNEDAMIPAEAQWDYLNSLGWNTAQQLEDLITKEQIQVDDDWGSSGPNSKPRSGNAFQRNGNWQKPLHGSIEKVLEGCAALRKVRDKALKGEDLSHFEGTALWHMAIHTADGQDWFLKNTNWGKDEAGMRQLEHSVEKNYAPWTCKKMQEAGVCSVGTKCFDKKPPVDRVEGQIVVRDDLPESEWPEPSPVRYSLSAGDDFLQKLLKEIDELGDDDPNKQANDIKNIVKRSQVFDHQQQDVIKARIEARKLAKKAAITKEFKEARAEKEKEFLAAAATRTDSIVSDDGDIYRKVQPHGFVQLKAGGKSDKESIVPVCRFDIIVEEERLLVGDDKIKPRLFIGKFADEVGEIPFEIESDVWGDAGAFFLYFLSICGGRFNIKKQNVDAVRQVAMAYRKAERKMNVFYSTQGWYGGDTYLMPSVVIDKDGVRPNTEKPIILQNKGHASSIDFSILQEDELKEVLFHIKTEFFHTFHRGCTFMTFGHTMMAGIRSYLGIDVKPTMWLEGDSGHGKTKLAEACQKFYGDIEGGLNWDTSAKSMMDYGYQFKDCMLLADDYKGTQKQIIAVQTTVQNAYDFSSSGALSRTGEQRGDKKTRCMYVMTGEETPVNQASVIARMCLMEYPKFDKSKTQELYEKCKATAYLYKGVTPYFIHWILQRDKALLKTMVQDDRLALKEAIAGTQNDDRVATNVGMAYSGFRFFTNFLRDMNIIDKNECTALLAEAKGFAESTRDKMAIRCAEEKNGNVFVSRLKELLMNGEASIKGLDGYDNLDGRSAQIGFMDKNPKAGEEHVAYLYTGVTLELIKGRVKSGLVASTQSIGTQLTSLGVMFKTSEGRNQFHKKVGKGDIWVWAVDLVKLGLVSQDGVAKSKTESLALQPVPNAEGLI